MLKTIDRNVIIKETEDKEYIQNGIIIKSSNTSNIIGNVVCVGENVVSISVGDKVIFPLNISKKIIYENTEYFVVNEKDILAII